MLRLLPRVINHKAYDVYPKVFSEDMEKVLKAFFDESAEKSHIPAMDVYEEGEKFFVHIDLPGYKREDIDISFDENVLTIKGEVVRESEADSGKKYHIVERRIGAFERRLRIPDNIDPSDITARFTDGVLEVVLVKTTKPEARKIPSSKSFESCTL